MNDDETGPGAAKHIGQGRDGLDRHLSKAAIDRALRTPLEEGHVSEEELVLHLRRKLSPSERLGVIRHLAHCSLCCDRLENAADVLHIDPLPSTFVDSTTPDASPPVDIGASLMSVAVAIGRTSLQVLHSDAAVRVEMAAAVRRGHGHGGVGFERGIPEYGTLNLEIIEGSPERLHIGLRLSDPPVGCRVSRIGGGKLLETRPLRDGQAIFRNLAPHLVFLRIEAPRKVLGHIRLVLEQGRDE